MLCLETLFWALFTIYSTQVYYIFEFTGEAYHTFITEATEYVRTGLQNYQQKGDEHIHFEMIWRLIRERLANMVWLAKHALQKHYQVDDQAYLPVFPP